MLVAKKQKSVVMIAVTFTPHKFLDLKKKPLKLSTKFRVIRESMLTTLYLFYYITIILSGG